LAASASLVDVKGLERKHFWPLLGCCPGGADENHEYLSQASSFPAEISAELLPFYKSKCYD